MVNNLKLKIIPLIFMQLGFCFQSKAGTVTSGGGGAYVCRDRQGNITSSHLVDLWEAANIPSKWNWPLEERLSEQTAFVINPILKNEESAQVQFEKALAKVAVVDFDLAESIRKMKEEIFGNTNKLPERISISVPEDLKTGYFPTGCPVEGMMYYNGDTKRLDLKPEIFAALSTQTDIAAAWMHESIYKVMRDANPFAYSKDSKPARLFTGCIFSDFDCFSYDQKLVEGIIHHEGSIHYSCKTENIEFDFYDPNFNQTKVGNTPYAWIFAAKAIFKRLATKKIGYEPAIYLTVRGYREDYSNHTQWRMEPESFYENPFQRYTPGMMMADPSFYNFMGNLKLNIVFYEGTDTSLSPNPDLIPFEFTELKSFDEKIDYLPHGAEKGSCVKTSK